MSVEAVRAAFEHSTARPTARLVLLALAEAANRDEGHESWLAVDTIRQRTGLSERAVQTALRDLEASDEIGRVGAGRGGRSRSTRYRILLMTKGAGAAPFDQGERVQELPERVQETTEKGAGAAPDPLRTKKNRRARARDAESVAPRGQHHNNRGAIAGAAAYAGPRPSTDCGTVTTLDQGRCDPCYEHWAEALLAADEAQQAAP